MRKYLSLFVKYLSLFVLAMYPILVFIGCSKKETKLFALKDASETGLFFQNNLTEETDFNILNYLYYYNGGGVSVGDINNDGLEDIFLISNLESNKLYLNKGGLKFEDITKRAGVGGQHEWSTGSNMVDINGDGFLDIYVCNLGNFEGKTGKNELFLNNTDGTFTEVASIYGLDFSTFSTQSCFFDYDNDGDLDMYLLNHAIHTIEAYVHRNTVKDKIDSRSGDRLLRNNLEKGEKIFTDVTFDAGIQSSPIGFGLGVAASDINNDGLIDLYISNDFHENDYLYINKGDGTFNDMHSKWIGHTSKYSMGNDINNDGLPDIMTLDMLPDKPEVLQKSMAEDDYTLRETILEKGYAPQLSRNTLQLNRKEHFSDVAPLMGVEATDWSWSPLFADFDNDGFKDLYITNGIYRRPNDLDYLNYTSNSAMQSILGLKNAPLSQKLIVLMPQLKISNKAYRNRKGQYFKDKADDWGLNVPSYSNGAAYADLDNDGDLDLIVNNINDKVFLFENKGNEIVADNSYLKIQLIGNDFNSTGVGTKLVIKNDNKSYYQENLPVRGFMSSTSHVLHFGLGQLRQIDSLWVIWPGGANQLLTNIETNQTLQINEKEASGNYYREQRTLTPEKDTFFTYKNSASIDYIHQENTFQDIDIEYLIPKKLSTEGPGVAVGDVNKDGLEDFFLTNAKNKSAQMYVQHKNGSFHEVNKEFFEKDSIYEGVDAVFFDADKDNDLDLYVASAGNEFPQGNEFLADRLYINDGKGNFNNSIEALPPIFENTPCVKPGDFDKDGDIDLFVGSRSVSGKYGLSPKSYILENDGNGNFNEVSLPNELEHMGMVTDAEWLDFDNDGWPDLVVVGEWMSITFIKNSNGSFENSSLNGLENTQGWWNSIMVDDFDNDGDMDLVAGNLGLNTRLKASVQEPVRLYLKDFDGNGSLDQIMTYYLEGKEYPFATKDQLSKQLNFLKKKFTSYTSFSGTTLEKLLIPERLKAAEVKSANNFQSVYIENLGDTSFKVHSLPDEANFSPIMDIVSKDVNNDGLKDMILAGNFYDFYPVMGRQDANHGLLLLQIGNNRFKTVPFEKSGIRIEGQVRDMDWITTWDGTNELIIVKNNEEIELLKLKDNL